jgi:uncharacterized membrane protein
MESGQRDQTLRAVHIVATFAWYIALWNRNGLYLSLRHLGMSPRITLGVFIALLSATACLATACGVALVYLHRKDRRFLPVGLYISYMAAAAAMAFMIAALLHDFVRLQDWLPRVTQWDDFTIPVGLLFALLAFVAPWRMWRRQRPTPVVVDAALLSLVALMGYDAWYFLRHGDIRRAPWYIWFVEGEYMTIWGVAALITLVVLLLGGRARVMYVISVILLLGARAALLPGF